MKMKIGLVFDSKQTAIKFVQENAPNGTVIRESDYEFIYETPIIRFVWLEPRLDFRGVKVNYIYTTKRFKNTEAFRTLVEPWLSTGVGTILDDNADRPQAFDILYNQFLRGEITKTGMSRRLGCSVSQINKWISDIQSGEQPEIKMPERDDIIDVDELIRKLKHK